MIATKHAVFRFFGSIVQEIPARRLRTMSSRIVDRLSGLALLVGSLLVVMCVIMQFLVFPHGTLDRYTSPLWQPIFLLMLLGVLLIVGGLPGMYVRQAERAGWPGLVGYTMTCFAVLLFGACMALFAFVIPLLDTHAQLLLTGYDDFNLNGGRIPPLVVVFQVAGLVLSIGTFLLGRATMRAGILPRSAGVALIVAASAALVMPLSPLMVVPPLGDLLWPLLIIGIPACLVAFFFALARFGFALLSLRNVEKVAPQRAATEATS
jgi:hypothetical protein